MPERILRRVREPLDVSRDLIAQSELIRQEAQHLAKNVAG
jgi:hypothetical protein